MIDADVVDAPNAKLKYLKSLQLERKIKSRSTMDRYYADRVAWAHDCID
jgi:hypothetical protein